MLFICNKFITFYNYRILSGSYDNSIHIWNTKGQHKLAIPGHTSPVKAVSWVSFSGDKAVFARFYIFFTFFV